MHTRTLTFAACAALLLTGCPASEQEARAHQGETIAFTAKGDEPRGAIDFQWWQQQGRDQLANPDYGARTAPLIPGGAANVSGFGDDRSIFRDPYHHQWLERQRGTYEATSFVNRYGARLHVDLYGPPQPFRDPVTGTEDAGPYPVVMLLPGHKTDVLVYEGFSQQLAENGYVVAVITPQGQAPSETDPSPMEDYCDQNGAWRQPQEGGITEHGECAGHDATPSMEGLTLHGAGDEEAQALFDELAYRYEFFLARNVFAALDAADWLESGQTPWADRMDLSRLGIAGHSAGAYGALIAANVDPKRRFDAVASWDSFGRPTNYHLDVPTLVAFSEQQPVAGPYPVGWNPMNYPSVRTSLQLLETGTPMFSLGLRGSNHSEWAYAPFRGNNPAAPLANASARGFQVSLYYSLAWMDYHLKGDSPLQFDDAERRLLAREFDESVDWTSISTGTFDPTTGGNAPYTIAGEAVQDHLSVWFPNILNFGGNRCLDWHEGCEVGR